MTTLRLKTLWDRYSCHRHCALTENVPIHPIDVMHFQHNPGADCQQYFSLSLLILAQQTYHRHKLIIAVSTLAVNLFQSYTIFSSFRFCWMEGVSLSRVIMMCQWEGSSHMVFYRQNRYQETLMLQGVGIGSFTLLMAGHSFKWKLGKVSGSKRSRKVIK